MLVAVSECCWVKTDTNKGETVSDRNNRFDDVIELRGLVNTHIHKHTQTHTHTKAQTAKANTAQRITQLDLSCALQKQINLIFTNLEITEENEETSLVQWLSVVNRYRNIVWQSVSPPREVHWSQCRPWLGESLSGTGRNTPGNRSIDSLTQRYHGKSA